MRTAPARALSQTYPWWRLPAGALAVAVVAIFAASQGSVDIPPFTVIKILISRIPALEITGAWPQSWDTILLDLRLPRILLAGLVGSALAVSGATFQGLFRNPLADPYLIGVAAGAGLLATVVLVTNVPIYIYGFSLLPIAAFLGALLAVAVSYIIAKQAAGLPLTAMILAGVAIGSLATAMTSLLIIRSDPDIKPLLGWLLGSFISAQWGHSVILLAYFLPSLLVILSHGRILNVLQLDEEQARQLGVNVEPTKVVLIAAASLATAAAVSFSGLIGFVGLIAPHAVRLLWGPEHRFLLPMSMLFGAGFLILADLVARTSLRPAELPVGVVTAFVGAPFFLYLLRRSKRGLF